MINIPGLAHNPLIQKLVGLTQPDSAGPVYGQEPAAGPFAPVHHSEAILVRIRMGADVGQPATSFTTASGDTGWYLEQVDRAGQRFAPSASRNADGTYKPAICVPTRRLAVGPGADPYQSLCLWTFQAIPAFAVAFTDYLGAAQTTESNEWMLIGYQESCLFPVQVVKDGGYAGPPSTWTYTVTDLWGYTLGTGIAPAQARNAGLVYTPAPDGSYALIFWQGNTLELWDVQETSSGAFPVGGIILWSGAIAAIPAGWALCDGTGGTPDLRDRFVVGAGNTYAPGANAGASAAIAAHAAADLNHNHTQQPHQHAVSGVTVSIAQQTLEVNTPGGGSWFEIDTGPGGTVSGSADNATAINNAANAAAADLAHTITAVMPKYYALAYIMRTS